MIDRFQQGGSNADNVLADAYLKGIRDGINVFSPPECISYASSKTF